MWHNFVERSYRRNDFSETLQYVYYYCLIFRDFTVHVSAYRSSLDYQLTVLNLSRYLSTFIWYTIIPLTVNAHVKGGRNPIGLNVWLVLSLLFVLSDKQNVIRMAV